MNLREWFTKDSDFCEVIDPSHRGIGSNPKVLGLRWNTDTDELFCTDFVGHCQGSATKRKILKSVCTVFDPLGFFSPVVVRGKAIIQQIWKTKAEWDSRLPDPFPSQFEALTTDLSVLATVSIPRFLNHSSDLGSVTHELHCFRDASGTAFATVVYLRSSATLGAPVSNNLFSKVKLCPIKPVTIPRLELMAVVLGVRAAKIVSAELRVKVSKFVLGTDLKCVLYWIHSPKVKLLDPADIPSRGCFLSELKSSSLWWRGPDFLLSPESSWPQNDFATSDNVEVEDLEPVLALLRVPVSDIGIGFIVDVERFSSLTKLLRVSSWIIRFRDKVTGRHLVFSDCLSSDELNAALLVWIRFVQASSFQDSDFKSAQFRHLNMFLDDIGILRCRGRLEHSSLPIAAKKADSSAKKICFHFSSDHFDSQSDVSASVRQTLASVCNDYWIHHGRSVVRSVLNGCQLCRCVEGGPFKLLALPALPSQRVVRDHPFLTTGVDYFGPLFIKHVNPAAPDQATMKVWICLFTCAVTRAIHLEVVLDNSSDLFFLCLQRFSAIYGFPSLLISDNAKQFVSASEILKTVFTSDSVQDFC